MSKAIEAIYRHGRVELPLDIQLPENTRVTVIVPESVASEPVPERTLQVLVASGHIQVPKPYIDQEPYVRQTPVPTAGEPVSEIIIQQRGPL